jgi:hypothetical protein
LFGNTEGRAKPDFASPVNVRRAQDLSIGLSEERAVAAIEDVLGSIGDIRRESPYDAGYPQSLSGSALGANGEQVPGETSSKEISLEGGRTFRGYLDVTAH